MFMPEIGWTKGCGSHRHRAALVAFRERTISTNVLFIGPAFTSSPGPMALLAGPGLPWGLFLRRRHPVDGIGEIEHRAALIAALCRR